MYKRQVDKLLTGLDHGDQVRIALEIDKVELAQSRMADCPDRDTRLHLCQKWDCLRMLPEDECHEDNELKHYISGMLER